MDNIPISDEQLAYLNENIDLVNEFTHTQRLQHNWQCTYNNYSVVIRYEYLAFMVVVKRLAGQYDYYCTWRKLLQFVEDHNSAPPILK